jgi:hypothetical protein
MFQLCPTTVYSILTILMNGTREDQPDLSALIARFKRLQKLFQASPEPPRQVRAECLHRVRRADRA